MGEAEGGWERWWDVGEDSGMWGNVEDGGRWWEVGEVVGDGVGGGGRWGKMVWEVMGGGGSSGRDGVGGDR